ncbi:MAG: DUF1491 family protein [Hyphomicrobiales bacterium]|nr:DUF1491 family protein [Hyphomicrobiales bacterium]MDE2114570.1 DUF1491 family protein [Hyphomicrobiales bacterium]
MRLRSDFFVSALLRRCALEGLDAVLIRRGAAEAGAIFVQVDDLAGHFRIYGPAPQSEAVAAGLGRAFALVHKASSLNQEEAATYMAKQCQFDADLWLVAIEDRSGDKHEALLKGD